MHPKRFPRRAIHLDFHTMPAIYDVGSEFDAEAFAKTLADAGVDYITAFVRCNLGFAYYPTKIGTVHPGLKVHDLFGPMVDSCHRRGIRVAAYFNGGLDHEHALRHRDWCKVDPEGHVYRFKETDSNWFRLMCLNTAYRKHLNDMIAEVLDLYPVDGMFVDCLGDQPCYGTECIDGMLAMGLDPKDAHQARQFADRVNEEYRKETIALIRKKAGDIYMTFNGMSYVGQPKHMEIECLPQGAWGYDFPRLAPRYTRTLGKPSFLMTGRFHNNWGDMGGLRPEAGLAFDCFNSVANAITCSVGDHMHPRGRLNPPVYDLIGRVYREVAKLDPWADDARALADIAVVHPGLVNMPSGFHEEASVSGATRILTELQHQVDVCDGSGDLSGYKVLILPDNALVDDKLKPALARQVKRGGAVIGSAWGGMKPDKSGFAVEGWNVKAEGAEPYNRTFFRAHPEIARDLPAMDTTIYDQGIAMKAGKGARVLAELVQPYFNQHSWDWHHANFYVPPEKESGRAALVRSGNIFHFSFPVFSSYSKNGVLDYKLLVRNCLEQLLPEPLTRSSLPSYAQLTVTAQPGRRMLHVLAYLPEHRGNCHIVEEAITLRDVELGLRADGQQVGRVYLAPSGREIPFRAEGAYIKVTVPEVNGYQMVVFEG